jgi:hypothetical protein
MWTPARLRRGVSSAVLAGLFFSCLSASARDLSGTAQRAGSWARVVRVVTAGIAEETWKARSRLGLLPARCTYPRCQAPQYSMSDLKKAGQLIGQAHPNAEMAILIGSRKRGSAKPSSDYDIVVVVSDSAAGPSQDRRELCNRVTDAAYGLLRAEGYSPKLACAKGCPLCPGGRISLLVVPMDEFQKARDDPRAYVGSRAAWEYGGVLWSRSPDNDFVREADRRVRR